MLLHQGRRRGGTVYTSIPTLVCAGEKIKRNGFKFVTKTAMDKKPPLKYSTLVAATAAGE